MKSYADYLKEYQNRSLEELNNSYANERMPNKGNEINWEGLATFTNEDISDIRTYLESF